MKYLVRKGFKIRVGFKVVGSDIAEAAELTNDILKDLKIDTAELKARIEKAIEAAKSAEKKPAGPAK